MILCCKSSNINNNVANDDKNRAKLFELAMGRSGDVPMVISHRMIHWSLGNVSAAHSSSKLHHWIPKFHQLMQLYISLLESS